MNLRCAYCQTPFTVGRTEMVNALQALHAEGLHHYDAHCPRCRKTNQVPIERLERAVPNWQELAAAQDTPQADDTKSE